MSKKIHTVKILKNDQLASDIFRLEVERPSGIDITPCQFFNIGVEGNTMPLLKRPISVCDWTDETIVFVIKQIGKGTKAICETKPGQELLLVGALGNGIATELYQDQTPWILIGGGIGTAPLVGMARVLQSKGISSTAIMGYLNETYLIDDYQTYSNQLIISTIEGIEGTFKGNALEAMFETIGTESLKQYNIAICGPDKMLHAAKDQILPYNNNVYLVTEEKMACGMGACLVCAKKVTREDGLASMVRTCIEGPVFKAEEVIFE